MLIQMRGCPTWKTSRTLAMAITALTAIIPGKLCQMQLLESIGQRIADTQFTVMDHAGQHEADQDIKNGGDDQGIDHGPRKVALRVFALLGRGGDGIEPDVGKEDARNTFQYARQIPFGAKGRQFFGIHIESDPTAITIKRMMIFRRTMDVAATFVS